MEISGAGKSPNTALSFRYNANNEALEQLYNQNDEDPPTPQFDASPSAHSENASPKKLDKTSSLIDKYFKRADKDKPDDTKSEPKGGDEVKIASVSKEVSSSPVKDYLNRLSKRSAISEGYGEVKEPPNETWKIFSDFKFKIAQAVEDIKSRSNEDTKEKVPREGSMSDSEDSPNKDCSVDQSIGDTDNQVSSLDSSIQNLSELTQPVTAKANECDPSLISDKKNSDSSDNTHKNLGQTDSSDASHDLIDDNLMDVESGVEAVEEPPSDIVNMPTQQNNISHENNEPQQPSIKLIPSTITATPNKKFSQLEKTKGPMHFINFMMIFLTFILLISYLCFPNSNSWNGFVFGLWVFYFLSECKRYVLDTYFCDWETDKSTFYKAKRNTLPSTFYTMPSVKEHRPLKKHEGWINHYRMPDYDPSTYHINKTITAFMKLEGSNLRISYTRTKVAKRELWDEKLDKVDFYQHRLYNLSGARVILLPKGLVKRRQWSKKYPICVILDEKETIQVLERENGADKKDYNEKKYIIEPDTSEINASPEKKKKFTWRKREKSISEGESAKEGLRHRITRKLHKDKKADSSATLSDPPQTQETTSQSDKNVSSETIDATKKSECSMKNTSEDYLDESEISRIKDYFEEAEIEATAENDSEGGWSVRVKQTSKKHSHLYLFARTGRDKHEWFRRLITAAVDGKGATDGSDSTDKTMNKEKDDLAVYKVTGDKDTVSFAKPNSKSFETIASEATCTSISYPLKQKDLDIYEKIFWPYLFKIIQQPKKNTSDCGCNTLPGEVTWINTMLARVVFDVMRDPIITHRLQDKIQRKLATLKLPAFMSPLLVTELKLGSACPIVEHIWGPAWDERGIWLDADLRYEGGAYITILTQINLMKLKEKNDTEDEETNPENEVSKSEPREAKKKLIGKKKPAIYDSDLEDSAESSSDDEAIMPIQDDDIFISESTTNNESVSSKKKFLRIVDKIATNKYFQQVTDYKYIKRAMEGLSNTDIKLQVDIRFLEGRLALNLPPPPHDRLWIGFRTNPQLILKAKPAFGARSLSFTQISNWIEQKLTREFEKVLVLPNMEDLVIDLMTPTPIHFDP